MWWSSNRIRYWPVGVADVGTNIFLAGLTMIIWGFESLFEYLYAVKWRNLAQTIQHELRVDAYDHTQHLELAYFEDRSTGGLMAVLNDDINQLERFLDIGRNDILQLITTVCRHRRHLHRDRALGGLDGAAAHALHHLWFHPFSALCWQPKYARCESRWASSTACWPTTSAASPPSRALPPRTHELQRITVESDQYQARNQDAITLSSAFVPLIRMVIMVGFIAIMVFGGMLVIEGTLAVGAYSVLVFMTQRLLWPLTRLGQTLDLYQRAMASTRPHLRLARYLDHHRWRASVAGGASAGRNPPRRCLF